MRLLFLNQYGPPDSPPTARLLGQLADFLRSRGHEVEILAQRQTYGGRPASGRERLRRELAAAWFILREGCRRRNPRPDAVLALSSPPGLLVVAALVAWWQRAPLAHWAMDLYPELAVALGEIPPGLVAATVQRAMRWAYRRCGLVVALDEDMQAHLQPFCRVPVRVLPPWPPLATEQGLLDLFKAGAPPTALDVEAGASPAVATTVADAASGLVDGWADAAPRVTGGQDAAGEAPTLQTKSIRPPATSADTSASSAAANGPDAAAPWTWLYSGNLGRAHEWRTLLDAQCLLEARGLPVRLAFQGDGAARRVAQVAARELGLQRCDWLDYVLEDGLLASLLAARVLIVTQRPETRGLLWPSKLAVLERLPRSILYIGPTDGAIAARLRVRGNVGTFAAGQAEEVAAWMEGQFAQGVGAPTISHQDVLGSAAGCAALERWLQEAIAKTSS